VIFIGILTIRKRHLFIQQTQEIFKQANIASGKKIRDLNESTQICSCPTCKSSEHVKYTGTNKGIRKFVCRSDSHAKSVWFSASTSYEAMEIYRDALAKNLCLLVQTNATVNGITDYNECSKHFVEYALQGLCDFINKTNQLTINISQETELISIFLDISGSGLAKNKAIILAKIQDKIFFDIITTSNYLSSHTILSQIKDRLTITNKTQIVFVTDGEKCFVDSIKHFFPNAIHIRQFHSKSCKGIVYIHLNYSGKDYTIRCAWDAVLEEGKASEKTRKMRELKAKRKLENKERAGKIEYTELSKEVIIWEGIVYLPRGLRRVKITKTKKRNSSLHNNFQRNTSPSDIPILFKGELKEAQKIEVFSFCFGILKKIFGGLYITSNVVETIFNFKSKFYHHRTIKSGDRLMLCILYGRFVLKNKTKQELMNFFKEKVITYDFVMKKVLYGSGIQKNKPEPPQFLKIIQTAIQQNKDLVMHYCDANLKHTSRIITPLKITLNEYDNTTTIESFCHLRKDKRTFYLERIRDITIHDLTPICF